MLIDRRRVLIVSPHPDDEVIGCGGLLHYARCRDAKVFVLYVCVGKSRQLVTGSTDEVTRIRELKDVAEVCGFDYRILFSGTEFVRLDTIAQKDLIDPIEDTIEEFKPDIVCIPPAESYDQDHRATYTACITALRPVPRGVRHFVPTVLVYEEPYTWTVSGGPRPNVYLDTSAFAERKSELMRLYASQDRQPPFSRSGASLVHYQRVRGNEVGVEAAEAYTLIRGCFQ